MTTTAIHAPTARCALGLAYVANDDRRAAMYLPSCDDSGIDRSSQERGQRAAVEVQERLIADGYVRISLLSSHPGLWVTVDGSPPDEVVTPAEVWALPGTQRVVADTGAGLVENLVLVEPDAAPLVVFEVRSPEPASAPAILTFADEPTEEMTPGPLPVIEHESLLPERYRPGFAQPNSFDEASPPRRPRTRYLPRGSIGISFGMSISDLPLDGMTPAAAVVGGAHGMLRLADSLSMHLRLDFTSRGGKLAPDDDKPTGPITFRLAGLLGYAVVDQRWFGVSLLGGFGVGAHVEREIAGHDISRLSVDAIAGVQLALTPWRFVTLDVLADQGLTTLVDDARARGLIVSVGLGNTFQ